MEKIKRLKILEWNINQRSKGIKTPDYVASEILRKEPDIIVLVEFKRKENSDMLEKISLNYHICHYNGVLDSSGKLDTGNGILMALNKEIFEKPKYDDIDYPRKFNNVQPDWLKVHTILKDGQILEITGVRVRTSYKDKDGKSISEKVELKNRKDQIEWLLNENKGFKNQIVIGDLNFGPHRNKYVEDYKINWQHIVEMIKSYGDLKEDITLYSPEGTSWRSVRLDWLITKGVYVNNASDYNKLDWSFGSCNKEEYVNGYLVPGGYFIITAPPYPDHAIFTAEIIL